MQILVFHEVWNAGETVEFLLILGSFGDYIKYILQIAPLSQSQSMNLLQMIHTFNKNNQIQIQHPGAINLYKYKIKPKKMIFLYKFFHLGDFQSIIYNDNLLEDKCLIICLLVLSKLKIKIANMSLYQQNPLSEEAFEEVNNILEDEGPSETDTLNFKILQLQKIITTLTRTNERLIQRIEDLEEQIELKSNEEESINFNQEYSVIQGNLGDAQEMVTQYKAELKKYQDHIATAIAQKNNEVQKLQQENQELRKQNESLKDKLDEYQEQNDQLLQTKESLITEIEELQSSLRKSKAQSPRYNKHSDYSEYLSRYDSEYTSDFGMNVQAQLQKLIEKLVKELEHERIIKKKLTQEIKKLQKDMLEQEKQLIAKNNKIYSLEITALKKNKGYTNGPKETVKHQPSHNRDNGNGKGYEERGRRQKEYSGQKLKNFSLMELMNECIILSSKEKLVISLKIIELYTRKMQRNDYSSEILQSITVCNYNPTSPHLSILKLNPNVDKDQDNEQEQTETSLVWNLVFVLDNLLSQTATKDHAFGEADREDALLEAINYYLQNKQMNNTDSIMQIRKNVQEALNDHIR